MWRDYPNNWLCNGTILTIDYVTGLYFYCSVLSFAGWALCITISMIIISSVSFLQSGRQQFYYKSKKEGKGTTVERRKENETVHCNNGQT